MIRTDLDLSYTQVGIVTSAFSITRGISNLPAGWLADRFGTRLLVVISISGVAVAGLLIGLSQSYTVLIIFLVIAAIVGGGYHPASAVAISAIVPPEHRGRALGFHSIGGTSAYWILPLIATPIAVAWGWRSSYITLAIPAIILGIVLYIRIGQRKQTQTGEQKTTYNKVPTTHVRVAWRKLLPFFLMSVAAGTMLHSVIAYLSLYAVDQLGVTVAMAGILVAVMPAVGMFAGPLGGYLSDRIGGVPVLLAVSFLAVPLVYLIGVVPNLLALIAVVIVIGILAYTRETTSEAYIIGHTPQRRSATILGIYFFVNAESGGLLTPVVGVLIDRVGFSSSFTIVSIALAVIVVVCTVFMWIAKEQY